MAGKGPTVPFPFTQEARQLLFNVIDSHNAAMDAGASTSPISGTHMWQRSMSVAQTRQ